MREGDVSMLVDLATAPFPVNSPSSSDAGVHSQLGPPKIEDPWLTHGPPTMEDLWSLPEL